MFFLIIYNGRVTYEFVIARDAQSAQRAAILPHEIYRVIPVDDCTTLTASKYL